MINNKVLLIIMDGLGIATDKEVSAPDQANTPFLDECYRKYPHSQLVASGESVGLPPGQMGNSEVGHIHIGSGRVDYQDLMKINRSIEQHEIEKLKVLADSLENSKRAEKKVHLIGLVSDGGIHSHLNHLFALCNLASAHKIDNLFIHAITDGRDTDPRSGIGFLEKIQDHLAKSTGKIATVIGRYYAMDRDNQWDRIKIAYDALVQGKGTKSTDVLKTMKAKYDAGETDEFIKPIIISNSRSDSPIATIEEGDMVVFFNFRTDRGRQLTNVLTQKPKPEFGMKPIKLDFLTMTNYDETFENLKIIYDKDDLKDTLGEVVSSAGLKQLRIAETQKYAHVTYFFSGGREKSFEGEERELIKSSNVATYDLKPEMSAYEVKDKVIPRIQTGVLDFICLNFANPDMVGHTGVFDAAIKACEVVDECVKDVTGVAIENGYSVIITSDHGNSEYMKNDDGSPNTAHTNNPVPIILINGPENIKLNNGALTDIAPTILHLLNKKIPSKMTGKILFESLS